MKYNIKKYYKTIIRMFVLLVCSIVAATALLTLVHCMPIDSIRENAIESLETLNNEGAYPNASKYCLSRLDNYTDAIMINEAVYDGEENAFQKSLLSNMRAKEGIDPIPALNMVLNGQQNQLKIRSYARYWHGYLIFLKPLLVLFNYNTIRIINLIIQSLINILICYALFKRNYRYMVAYILSICMIMPLAVAFSLQYSDIFYIFAIASLAILYKNDVLIKKDRYLLLFCGIGIATAFFDFLTYPIAAFGIPAVMYIVVNNTESAKTRIINMIKFFVYWGIGYALMWSSKWIMAYLFTGENIIADALNSVSTRTVTNEYSILKTIFVNIHMLARTPVTILLMVFIGLEIIFIIKKWGYAQEDLLKSIPYIIICVIPILWYAFACQHSYLHNFFTNKALIASVFACLCMIVEMRIKTIENNKILEKEIQ